MRFVAVKTTAQQDLQALHRLREGVIRARTAHVNRLRGLLAEYGVVVAKSVSTFRRALPALIEDGENGLSDRLRRLLAMGREQLAELDVHIEALTDELHVAAAADDARAAPADDPWVWADRAGAPSPPSWAMGVSTAGVGTPPRPWGSRPGSTQAVANRCSSASAKRGERYLRCLLVHGARSVVVAAKRKSDPFKPLGQPAAGNARHEQSDRGARQQTHPHRLGGAQSRERLSIGIMDQ